MCDFAIFLRVTLQINLLVIRRLFRLCLKLLIKVLYLITVCNYKISRYNHKISRVCTTSMCKNCIIFSISLLFFFRPSFFFRKNYTSGHAMVILIVEHYPTRVHIASMTPLLHKNVSRFL